MAASDPARKPKPSTDPDLWVAVGIVGVVVFLIGVYQPALARFPYPGALQVGVAVAGACLAVLGFTYAQRARAHRPRRALPPAADRVQRLGPSFEVYDPRTEREAGVDVEPPSTEPMEPGPP
jgi:hypothetical protein